MKSIAVLAGLIFAFVAEGHLHAQISVDTPNASLTGGNIPDDTYNFDFTCDAGSNYSYGSAYDVSMSMGAQTDGTADAWAGNVDPSPDYFYMQSVWDTHGDSGTVPLAPAVWGESSVEVYIGVSCNSYDEGTAQTASDENDTTYFLPT